MGGTATQGSRPRVKNPVYRNPVIIASVFRILLLHFVRGIVPDEEVPSHRVVLAGKAMERGHVIIVRQAVDGGLIVIAARQLTRIAAGFQQQHGAPGFGQPRREGSAAGARTDDNIFELVSTIHHTRPISLRHF